MKPSRRMHEVYNPTYKLIVFCGSQQACLRYAQNRQGHDLIVRVAGR